MIGKNGGHMYHLNRLRCALIEAKGLSGAAGAEAAYEVANCLGRCRVLGIQIPSEEDGTLGSESALKAAKHARWLTKFVKQSLPKLLASQDQDVEFDDEFYMQDSAAGIVVTRHELWCAMLAIYEADDALSRDGQGNSELTNELTLLIEELAALDALMIQHVEVFSCVVALPLLSNLRSMVKIQSLPKLESLPWWLDGTIEKAAEQAMEKFLKSLPDPAAIERNLRPR